MAFIERWSVVRSRFWSFLGHNARMIEFEGAVRGKGMWNGCNGREMGGAASLFIFFDYYSDYESSRIIPYFRLSTAPFLGIDFLRSRV
jgi:hypothetical protein